MIFGFASDMIYSDETAYFIENKIKHNLEE